MRFLRSIPLDPMTKSKEWGLRSMQDDPDSDSWGGQNVFDVYTKSGRLRARRHKVQRLVEKRRIPQQLVSTPRRPL